MKKSPVLQFDLSGKFIKEWSSLAEIAKTLDTDPSNVKQCCNGKLNQLRGSIYRRKSDFSVVPLKLDVSFLDKRHDGVRKPVIQYDMDGNEICRFRSATDAHKVTDIDLSCIHDNCNGRKNSTHGFIFQYGKKKRTSSRR